MTEHSTQPVSADKWSAAVATHSEDRWAAMRSYTDGPPLIGDHRGIGAALVRADDDRQVVGHRALARQLVIDLLVESFRLGAAGMPCKGVNPGDCVGPREALRHDTGCRRAHAIRPAHVAWAAGFRRYMSTEITARAGR